MDLGGSAAWWVSDAGTSPAISEDVYRRYEAGADARRATMKAIARALIINEKTVSRHLSNIFTKADVSSPTAAAAWAHEQGTESGR